MSMNDPCPSCLSSDTRMLDEKTVACNKCGERYPLNGYVCFYKGKRTEVCASTTYEAQTKAAAFFKARKQYEVTAMLAEKAGTPVIHSTASI